MSMNFMNLLYVVTILIVSNGDLRGYIIKLLKD